MDIGKLVLFLLLGRIMSINMQPYLLRGMDVLGMRLSTLLVAHQLSLSNLYLRNDLFHWIIHHHDLPGQYVLGLRMLLDASKSIMPDRHLVLGTMLAALRMPKLRL